MRSRVLALMVAFVASGVACAGGSASREDDALTFLLAANAEEVEGYRTLVSDFEDESGLDVAMTPFAKKSDLLARLTTGISGGVPPDVFLVNWRTYGQFAAAGALEPVGPYLADSDDLEGSAFTGAALDAFRYGGDETLVCMPQNTSSLVVYYHADRFEEQGLRPPREGWTWDEFVSTARALTGGEHYGVGIDAELIKIAPWVWQNGGEFVDDPVQPTRLTLDDGPAREALDWYLDLSLEHGVVPPDDAERSLDKLSRFLQGGLGMLLSSRVEVPTLRTIDDFDWDVGPLARPADGDEATTVLHSDAYCIAAASDRKDDAWRFIEFAMGQHGQEILAESGRTVPSRTDVANSPAFLQPDAEPRNSEVYLRNLDRMRVTPTIGSWPKVEQVGDSIVEDIFYGRIPREAGIERLHRETDPLFEQVPGG